MSDICVVYSRKNESSAEQLVAQLSKLWSVWWDEKIVGEFPTVIEDVIPKAKCIVPIWSADSRDNRNVLDELSLAQKHSVPIIPIKIDSAAAPYGYGTFSHVDLRNWNGETEHKGYQQLIRKVSSVIPPRSKPERSKYLNICDVPLPSLFLSVSSHETQLTPLEALKVLRVFGARTILISAYDLSRARREDGLIKEIKAFRKQGGVVLIDSGNYESTRLDDKTWRAESFHSAIDGIPHDMVFCFDVLKPSKSAEVSAKLIMRAVERDAMHTKAPVLPIVHAPHRTKGGYELEMLPDVVRMIAESSAPPMIAIPERELGPGLMQRAKMMKKIRESLQDLPYYQPIHLLGTGNPWSIAVLLAAGADSFDGLEWCRMAVDAAGDRLNHFQHFDFFKFQAQSAVSQVTRDAQSDQNVDFAGKVAFHNLEYYSDFLRRVQAAIRDDDIKAFVTEIITKDNARQLIDEFPDLYK